MASSAKAKALYPELLAGGYSRDDPYVHFYSRIDALLEPEMIVLDVGPGPGGGARDPCPLRRRLRTLRGRTRKVIGLDIDPEVKNNPLLDEAHVYQPGAAFPLPSNSVDLIVSDYTFEHVENPGEFVAEMDRVLKPGGWICARTPNRFGYIGIATNLIPNRYHARLIGKLQPGRSADNVYPTCYLMNTWGQLKALFPEPRYQRAIYTFNGYPQYTMNSSLLLSRLTLFLYRFTPAAFGATFMIFVRKKPDGPG